MTEETTNAPDAQRRDGSALQRGVRHQARDIELEGWLRKTASQMRGAASCEFDRHKRMLNAFATDIETAANIAQGDSHKARRREALMRHALMRLWSWTRAEAEHFDAAMPDHDIVEVVKAALDA